jgi:glycerol-3-phosphate dehydrogenase
VLLSPAYRRAAIRRLRTERFDVVVVGGGVVGCGVALDAASRGLDVALVEARDFASGTSSRSSKLLHGGLRYLEQGRIELVREALRERTLLLDRLCPHLARSVPILVPLGRWAIDRGYLGAGVALYDLLAGTRTPVPRHRHLTRRATLRLAPALRDDGVAGGILLHDGQVDDARHTITLARTAAHHGAVVVSSARAVGFLRSGERVTGVRVRDIETGDELGVSGRAVVHAAGVWTPELQELLGVTAPFRVRASKGVHIVVPRDRIDADAGLLLRTADSVLFVLPWGAHWLIGTTDTPWEYDRAHPAASSADIDYLLQQVNRAVARPIGTDDVVGVYAGLRPLLAAKNKPSSALSREHTVASPVPGLVAVAGGKYTTYRVMARDAVDAAVDCLGREVPGSCTHEMPLLGAEGWRSLYNARQRLAEASGIEVARIERLLERHGSETTALLDLIEAEPDLARPLPGANDHLAAEVRWAVEAEGALHLDDVLARRTRISIQTLDRGAAAAPAAAELMASSLGWTSREIEREVRAYRDRVEAERQANREDTDASAALVRLGVVDLRSPLATVAG